MFKQISHKPIVIFIVLIVMIQIKQLKHYGNFHYMNGRIQMVILFSI